MDIFNLLSKTATPFAHEIFRGINGGIALALLYIVSFAVLWALSYPLEKIFVRLFRDQDQARQLDARIQMLRKAVRSPIRIVVILAVVHALSTAFNLPAELRGILNQVFRISVILFGTWMFRRIITGFTGLMMDNLQHKDDDWKNREARTRIIVFRRVSTFILFILAIGLTLEGFDSVREIGMSILASAGIAGVVLGFAAQKSISGVIAGMQLALTQPLRIGDTVIVDGHWGKVEEIGLTHIVIRIWDLRRLVVPIQKILDEPFENWTRASTNINGTVYLHVDYRLPFQVLRTELRRIVEKSDLWNGETVGMVVTDATEKTMQVRALVSANDASSLWDLRCEVREKLISFLQDYENGAYLPRIRLEGLTEDQAP